MLEARVDEVIVALGDVRNLKDPKFGYSSPLNQAISSLSEKMSYL